MLRVYLFGGKELQTELDLGWSDFGVRCFDNWKAKWEGMDILSEYNANSSPYAYTLGNPIRYSDPTGMIEEDEFGMMSVSTDLWGSGGSNWNGGILDHVSSQTTNASGIGSTNNPFTERGTNGDASWLGDGQLARNIDTYTFDADDNYTFNKYAGEEIGRETTGVGLSITYAGAFLRQGYLNGTDITWEFFSNFEDVPVVQYGGTIGGLDLLGGVGLISRVPKGEVWWNVGKQTLQKGGSFVSKTGKYLRTKLSKSKTNADFSKMTASRGTPFQPITANPKPKSKWKYLMDLIGNTGESIDNLPK